MNSINRWLKYLSLYRLMNIYYLLFCLSKVFNNLVVLFCNLALILTLINSSCDIRRSFFKKSLFLTFILRILHILWSWNLINRLVKDVRLLIIWKVIKLVSLFVNSMIGCILFFGSKTLNNLLIWFTFIRE